MRSYTSIEVVDRDGIRWIYFNRPNKLNAFNRDLMKEVIDAVKQGNFKALVFSGKGKLFSAGIDLAELASSNDCVDSGNLFEVLAEMAQTVLNVEAPVIIALNGSAYGGGAEFLWLGDFVVAPKDIVIGWPEARWGLIPPFLPSIGSYTLGVMRAQYLAYTSGSLTAEDAYKMGLITKLVDSKESLEEAVSEILEELKLNSPESFKSLKKYFRVIKSSAISMYGVSELIRLGRDPSVIERARRFVDKKEYPNYGWL